MTQKEMLKENAQSWNFDPFKKVRVVDSRGHFIGNLLLKFFSVNFTPRNCEEFYVKETTKCFL